MFKESKSKVKNLSLLKLWKPIKSVKLVKTCENPWNMWKPSKPVEVFDHVGWTACATGAEKIANILQYLNVHIASFCFEPSSMAIMWRIDALISEQFHEQTLKFRCCTSSLHLECFHPVFLPHPSLSCKFNLRCIQDTSNEHVNSFPAYYMKLEAAFFLPCLQNTIVLLRPQRKKLSKWTLPK